MDCGNNKRSGAQGRRQDNQQDCPQELSSPLKQIAHLKCIGFCDEDEIHKLRMRLKKKSEIIQDLSEINMQLYEKSKSSETMEENIQTLESQNQAWQQKSKLQTEQVQQLEAKNKMLEDVCLRMKRKNRGFFGRNHDGYAEFEEMKAQQKKKKGKQVVVENQGEDTVSVISARCTQACDLERKSCETLTIEHRVHLSQLEQKILNLTETIEAQTKLLSQSNQSWQDKYDTLKEKSALTENGLARRNRYLLSQCNALEEMYLQQIDTTKDVELEKRCLVLKEENYQLEIQQLTDGRHILEEVCLQLKRRTLGCFGRKMQDRDTELNKMKNKMEVKQKKKGKQVVVENQAETVSVISARCTQACDLERFSWETLVEPRVQLSQLEEKVLSLSETLEAQKQLLGQSNQSWQDKYDALKEKSALTENGLEARNWNLLSYCKAVEEKCQYKIDTAEVENQVLVQKQQSHESEIQQFTNEREILDEIRLQLNRRTLGCFGRKMKDRDRVGQDEE